MKGSYENRPFMPAPTAAGESLRSKEGRKGRGEGVERKVTLCVGADTAEATRPTGSTVGLVSFLAS
jgi:hypothetical protein